MTNSMIQLKAMMIEDSDTNNLVEEFPKPPLYYKSVCASDLPPAIPADVDPYAVVYGGSFASASLLPKSNKSGPIFAEDMKDGLKETLEKALSLVAVTTTNHTQIGLTATDVRASFASLYVLLKEYRSHEALALLVEDRKSQLLKLHGIEKKLTECIHSCKEAIDQAEK